MTDVDPLMRKYGWAENNERGVLSKGIGILWQRESGVGNVSICTVKSQRQAGIWRNYPGTTPYVYLFIYLRTFYTPDQKCPMMLVSKSNGLNSCSTIAQLGHLRYGDMTFSVRFLHTSSRERRITLKTSDRKTGLRDKDTIII